MYYFYFGVATGVCKINARGAITMGKNLQTLKIPVEEYKGKEDQDEIWYEGNLYDVGLVVIHNDTAYVSVFHDSTEEVLVKITNEDTEHVVSSVLYNSHISKHMPHPIDDNNIPISKITYQLGITEILSFCTTFYLNHLPQTVYPSVIKPPPQVLVA